MFMSFLQRCLGHGFFRAAANMGNQWSRTKLVCQIGGCFLFGEIVVQWGMFKTVREEVAKTKTFFKCVRQVCKWFAQNANPATSCLGFLTK